MVPGIGWHSPERMGDVPFCWTGPTTESWIALRIDDRGDQRFRCRLLHAREQDIAANLELRVNGRALNLRPRAWDHGIDLEAQVPASVLERQGGLVRIDLQTAQVVRRCDVDQSSSDIRQRGVAVHAIEFEPLP
jgi:hypothetical protein